jgi:hypothetical protein
LDGVTATVLEHGQVTRTASLNCCNHVLTAELVAVDRGTSTTKAALIGKQNIVVTSLRKVVVSATAAGQAIATVLSGLKEVSIAFRTDPGDVSVRSTLLNAVCI